MRKIPFILEEALENIISLLDEYRHVKIVGIKGTGKSTIIERLQEKFRREKTPYHLIGEMFYQTPPDIDIPDKNPLVLSILSSNKKVLRAYKLSKFGDSFINAANAVKKYLTTRKQNGILIIENYNKLGQHFLNCLTPIFWNNSAIRILVTVEPTADSPMDDVALQDFAKFTLNAEYLHQIFIKHQAEIFFGTAFNREKQERIIRLSNHFYALQYFLTQKPDMFEQEVVVLKDYFDMLMNARGKNAVNVLQNSAVIGILFDLRYLYAPLNVEGAAEIIRHLCDTGEICSYDAPNYKYQFSYQELFEYVLQTIPGDARRNLQKQLAEYFYEEAQRRCNIPELVEIYNNMLYQSYYYFLESGETEKVCALAFHLADYYYSNGQYDALIKVSSLFLKCNAEPEIKLYFTHRMVDVLLELSVYPQVCEFLREAHNVRIVYCIAGYSELYEKLQQAEYNYLKSCERLSLQALIELKNTNEYVNDRYLGYRINMLMASVLYNVADKPGLGEPFTYFQHARRFGIFIQDNSYYKLLQKAILFQSDKANKEMINAYEYFKINGNIAEAARSKSNLGVYHLEKREYESAKQCFKEAQSLLREHLAENLLAIPLNNLAVIYMLEGNFEKAVTLLCEARKYTNDEEFTIITIAFNLSACYYKLRDGKNSQKQYRYATEIISASRDGESHFYEIFEKVHRAMYALDCKETECAVEILNTIDTPHKFYLQLISAIKGTSNEQQFTLPYLIDVLRSNVCPHYMVFE